MLTYKEIPIGPEADEYWCADLLYVAYIGRDTWYKDSYTPEYLERAPTKWDATDVKYAILVED